MISSGLSRLAEYEIQWPEVKRKIPSIGKDIDLKFLKLGDNDALLLVNTTEDEAKAVESWSWIQALGKVNQALELEGPRKQVIFNSFIEEHG